MLDKYYSTAPQFDGVYVVSDVHMGGAEPNQQIFNQGDDLAKLVRGMASMEPGRRLALVFNGDTVDFLAEKDATYFDPDNAIKKLDDVVGRKEFKAVWEALREYVATPNRTLVFTLGNHEPELALPWVRERLVQHLVGDGDGVEERRARVMLCFDGTGFFCTVGGKQVLCLHGNETDITNVIDYEALRRAGRDRVHGRKSESWRPNAGTKLVIDVMNTVKKTRPFVDILKPTGQAVAVVVATLDWKHAKRAVFLPSVLRRGTWDYFRRKFGFLTMEDDETSLVSELPVEPEEDAEAEFVSIMRATFLSEEVAADEVDALLDEVGDTLDTGAAAEALGEEGEETLGALDFLRRFSPAEALRIALKAWREETTFAWDTPDSTYTKFHDLVGAEVDVLITGHTHLEKAIRRERALYFNCGTWARLMRLTDEMVEDEAHFKPIHELLTKKAMADLDACPGLVELRPSVVCVAGDGQNVTAGLYRFDAGPGQLKAIGPNGSSCFEVN